MLNAVIDGLSTAVDILGILVGVLIFIMLVLTIYTSIRILIDIHKDKTNKSYNSRLLQLSRRTQQGLYIALIIACIVYMALLIYCYVLIYYYT